MGNNLSTFKKWAGFKPKSRLLELSLEQLKAFYAEFKSACDHFWIDYDQFQEIFSEAKPIFDLWDSSESGLVDALEVFAGLAVYAETKFEDKIRFLFDIFDFNQFNSLSLNEIELIVIFCLTSVFHICKAPTSPSADEVHVLVAQNFREDIRVNLTQLIEFSQNSKDIDEFFQLIDRDFSSKHELSKSEIAWLRDKPESAILPYLEEKASKGRGDLSNKNYVHMHGGQVISSRDIRKRNNYIYNSLHDFKLAYLSKRVVKSLNLRINWVYGFRSNNSIKSFVCHRPMSENTNPNKLDEKIIYCAGNIIVLYYYRVHKQRYYLEHRNEVSAITISQGNDLCATGEKGKHPMICVWSPITLATSLRIYSQFLSDIYLLLFTSNDTRLVTACKFPSSPLFVYEIKSGNCLMSTKFSSFAIDLIRINNRFDDYSHSTSLIDPQNRRDIKDELTNYNSNFGEVESEVLKIRNAFFCYSKTEVRLFKWKQDAQEMKSTIVVSSSTSTNQDIVQCCALMTNPEKISTSFYKYEKNLVLVLYVANSNGMVDRWTKNKSCRQWEKSTVHDFKRRIEQMILFDQKFLCLATKNGMIHLLEPKSKKDGKVLHEIVYEIDITHLNTRLNSTHIKNLWSGCDKNLLFSTWEGDLAKIKLRTANQQKSSPLPAKLQHLKFQSIMSLQNSLSAMCRVKLLNDYSYLLYIASEDGMVYCISESTHELLEKWRVKDSVTAIAGSSNEQGSVTIAVGMINGHIVFFCDHEEKFTVKKFKTPVQILKFTKDGHHLFASALEKNFYLFRAKNGTFDSEVIIHPLFMLKQLLPFSVNFSKDSCIGLIQTESERNMFYFRVKNPDTDELIQLQKISILPSTPEAVKNVTKIKLQFPTTDPSNKKRSLPFVYNAKLGVSFVASNEGFISAFDSVPSIKNQESTFYGHSGTISDLEFCAKRKVLFTTGRTDHIFIEWKVDYEDHPKDDEWSTLRNINNSEGASHFRGEIMNVRTPSDIKFLKMPMAIRKEVEAHQNMKVKNEYLEESLGYFRGYASDELRRILDLHDEAPTIVSNSPTLRYPACSVSLVRIYGLQNFQLRNNYCYFYDSRDEKSKLKYDEIFEPQNLHSDKKFNEEKTSSVPRSEKNLRSDGNFENPAKSQTISRSYLNNSQVIQTVLDTKMDVNSQKYDNEPHRSPLKRSTSRHCTLVENVSMTNIKSQAQDSVQKEPLEFADDNENVEEESLVENDCLNTLDDIIGDRNLIEPYQHSDHCVVQMPCTRRIAYFISRVAIVMFTDEKTHQQKQLFYEGHTAKISALAFHVELQIIATGERTYLPKIHIWDPLRMQTITICDTFHRQGIGVMKFSFEKALLLSISSHDETSIQISDSHTGNVMAFRNAFTDPIVSCQFDKIDESQFVTASRRKVDFWKFEGNSIVHARSVSITQESSCVFATDLLFLYHKHKDEYLRGVLVAKSDGGLGVIYDDSFFEVDLGEKSEESAGILRIIGFGDKCLIFATFGNAILKVFDTRFKEVFKLDLAQKTSISKTDIQSLDLFMEEDLIFCLIGLTCGLLVEECLRIYYTKDRQVFLEHLPDKSSLVMRGHTSTITTIPNNESKLTIDKQIVFCVYQRSNTPVTYILLSAGTDQVLYFWNIETNQINCWTRLPKRPTVMKFTPSTNYLVIGFADGSVSFYSRDSFLQWYDKANQIDDHPNFFPEPRTVQKCELNSDCGCRADERDECEKCDFSVLNVEIFKTGSLIAISYINNRPQMRPNNSRVTPPAIAIYKFIEMFRVDGTSVGSSKILQREKILQSREFEMNDPHIGKQLWISAYHMTFSDDGSVLIAYYQKIRISYHTRKVSDNMGWYIVFSLTSGVGSELHSKQHSYKANYLFSPVHINGKRILGSIKSSPDYSEKGGFDTKAFLNLNNDQIVVSCATSTSSQQSNLQGIALLGSKNGDIYLVKKSMLGMFRYDSVQKESNLFQAKRFPGHTSFVNQIEFAKDKRLLFTTGIDDECVFQWEISPEVKTDLDHLDGIEMQDKYNLHEVEDKESFKLFTNQTCPNRKRISDVLLQKDSTVFPVYDLILYRIIGRKAYSRRSNIIPLSENKFLYFSGTALVCLERRMKESDDCESVQLSEKQILSKKRSTIEEGNSPSKKGSRLSEHTENHHSFKTKTYIHSSSRLGQTNMGSFLPNKRESNFVNSKKIEAPSFVKRAETSKRAEQSNAISKYLLRMKDDEIPARDESENQYSAQVHSDAHNAREKPFNAQRNIEFNDSSLIQQQDFKDKFGVRSSNLLSCDSPKALVHSHLHHPDNPNQSPHDFFAKNDHASNKGHATQFDQHCIFPNINYQIKAPTEVMCFEMDAAKKTLCVATRDEYSSILFWDIDSETFKGALVLEQCISPIILRISHDSKFLVCCGLTKDYSVTLYYCNIPRFEVLAMLNLKYSDAKKIVDLAFFPEKNDEFMTVGFIHVAHWKYKAGTLQFQEIDLKREKEPRRHSMHYTVSKQEESHSLFLVIKFLPSHLFVLSDATGNLYLCHDRKMKDRQNFNKDTPITAIGVNPANENIFAVGGFCHEIGLYYACDKNGEREKMHLKLLRKVEHGIQMFVRSTLDEEERAKRHEWQVQTIAFTSERNILIGTRDGSIHEFGSVINENLKEIKCDCEDLKNRGHDNRNSFTGVISQPSGFSNLIIKLCDHQEPAAADFSIDESQALFCASRNGHFSAYDFESMTTLFTYEFQDIVQNLFTTKNYVLLMFSSKILFLPAKPSSCAEIINIQKDSQANDQFHNVVRIKNDESDSDAGFFSYIQLDHVIDNCCMSPFRKYLALSIFRDDKESGKTRMIWICQVNAEVDHPKSKERRKTELGDCYGHGSKALRLLHKIEVTTCEIMDFSMDEQYFIYSETSGTNRVYYVNEVSCSFMGENFNTKIEWQGKGLMISETFKKLESHLQKDNRLISIVRIGDQAILTADEIGTVW